MAGFLVHKKTQIKWHQSYLICWKMLKRWLQSFHARS